MTRKRKQPRVAPKIEPTQSIQICPICYKKKDSEPGQTYCLECLEILKEHIIILEVDNETDKRTGATIQVLESELKAVMNEDNPIDLSENRVLLMDKSLVQEIFGKAMEENANGDTQQTKSE